MALYEIVYVSLAAAELSADELAELLLKARARNAAQDITGMMVYHRREFMQLLEGERDAVLALYERIVTDPRHSQVRKLWDGPIAERGFNDWSMAFVAPESKNLQDTPGYRDLLDGRLSSMPGDSTGKRLLLGMRDDFL